MSVAVFRGDYNLAQLKLGGFQGWDFPINGWYVLSHDMLYIKMSNPPSLH